jgi:DNA-binding CsgD family transcriptional regulator
VIVLAAAAALLSGLLGVPWLHALLAGLSIVIFRLAIVALPAFRPDSVPRPALPAVAVPAAPAAVTPAQPAPPVPVGSHQPIVAGPGGELTERELEVALLVSDGLTNREIADRLYVKESTIDKHLEHVRDKLDSHNRAEIVAILAQHGLIQPGRRRP